MNDLKDWLKTYIQAIVSDGDQVQVDVTDGAITRVYQIRVAPEDVGRVKGRRGRVIKALNSVAGLAGQERRVRHVVDVVDPQDDA